MNEKQFKTIMKICEELGWEFSLPQVGDDDEVPGLIMGTEDYVEGMLEYVPEDFADRFRQWKESQNED